MWKSIQQSGDSAALKNTKPHRRNIFPATLLASLVHTSSKLQVSLQVIEQMCMFFTLYISFQCPLPDQLSNLHSLILMRTNTQCVKGIQTDWWNQHMINVPMLLIKTQNSTRTRYFIYFSSKNKSKKIKKGNIVCHRLSMWQINWFSFTSNQMSVINDKRPWKYDSAYQHRLLTTQNFSNGSIIHSFIFFNLLAPELRVTGSVIIIYVKFVVNF